jgi:hypothetical protein
MENAAKILDLLDVPGVRRRQQQPKENHGDVHSKKTAERQ